MGREKLRVSIEDLDKSREVVFQDGDMVILDSIKDLPQICVKVDFFIICFCKKGCMQFDLDGKTKRINEHKMFLIMPNTSLDNVMTSPDLQGGAFCFSSRLIRSMFSYSTIIRDIAIQIKKQPIYDISALNEQFGDCIANIYKVIMKGETDMFYKESMHCLFRLSLYQIFNMVASKAESKDIEMLSRGDLTFHNFMEMLNNNDVNNREVRYFAEQLYISPKYLSALCKNISGKTASAWINETVSERIRYELIHSDKSIKEICNAFDFPNMSFFGRYVKKNLGDSPLAFRRKNVNS